MSRIDLLITNGGYGTVNMALAHGVEDNIMPLPAQRNENGKRPPEGMPRNVRSLSRQKPSCDYSDGKDEQQEANCVAVRCGVLIDGHKWGGLMDGLQRDCRGDSEFPSIFNLEMHNWKAVLDIPEPTNFIVSTKYFRFWAQAIAAGRLRDASTADLAAAAASQLADATQKEQSPIGLEIAVTEGTIKAWQSFAHKLDGQALQQISAAADMQDRFGQAEVDIPAREMYADMLLADNRPAEAIVQYRTALKFEPQSV
jgi:hypothetical protein